MVRFNDIAIEIPNLELYLELHAIKHGLKPGSFTNNLAINTPKIVVEF